MGGMTATADLLRPVLDDLAVVVARTQGHETAPTPCADLDVAGVRHHAASWLANFADGYADPGGQASEAGAEVPDDVDGLVASVRDSTARLDAAVRAGALDRPLKLGGNAMPGEMALSMILWEYVVHGWDLAAATGQGTFANEGGMVWTDTNGDGTVDQLVKDASVSQGTIIQEYTIDDHKQAKLNISEGITGHVIQKIYGSFYLLNSLTRHRCLLHSTCRQSGSRCGY